LEDQILERERVTADSVLRDERAEHSALLSHERDATDHDLSHERARSDKALAMRDEFMGIVSHDKNGTPQDSLDVYSSLYAGEAARSKEAAGRRIREWLAGAVGRWRIRFMIGVSASGVLWGVAGIIMFPAQSFLHQVFTSFVIAGMIAGSVATLSPLLIAFLLFAVPAMVPITVQFLLRGGAFALSDNAQNAIRSNGSAAMTLTGTITNFVVVTPVQYPGQTDTEPFARVFVLVDGFDVVLSYQPVIELSVEYLRFGLRVSAVWAVSYSYLMPPTYYSVYISVAVVGFYYKHTSVK